MHRLMSVQRLHAAAMDSGRAHEKAGQVTSVGPDGTTCRVMLHPDMVESGWIPVKHIGVGAAAIIVPPNVGDFVTVTPHEGDAENWIMSGRLFTTAQQAPASPVNGQPIKPGEAAIINASGSVLHMTADGNISIIAAVQLNLKGNLVVTGGITATQDIVAGQGGGDQISLQNHTHKQPNDGHGDTEFPTDPPTAGT